MGRLAVEDVDVDVVGQEKAVVETERDRVG
jgi:hypothetical protein